MKMFDFCVLSLREQVDLLYKEGVFIGKLKVNGQIRMLYQFNTFYSEIVYRRYRYAIEKISCFESTDVLEPYLNHINIKDMINCS